jgi:hypothetical protein
VTDYGLEAQKAAELHLAACNESLWGGEDSEALERGEWPETPASAPFCGCDTCIVREVLHAAWPLLLQAAGENIKKVAADGLVALHGIDYEEGSRVERGVLALELIQTLVLTADDVLAEEEDQNQGSSDDRRHDVEP